MSLAAKTFEFGGLIAVAELYDAFPERLQNIILEKNASLYKELYNMMSEEEKQEFNMENVEYIVIDDTEKKIEILRKEIEDIKNNPYNSDEARELRFKGMDVKIIDQSRDECNRQIKLKEDLIKSLMSYSENRKLISHQSKMFDI